MSILSTWSKKKELKALKIEQKWRKSNKNGSTWVESEKLRHKGRKHSSDEENDFAPFNLYNPHLKLGGK